MRTGRLVAAAGAAPSPAASSARSNPDPARNVSRGAVTRASLTTSGLTSSRRGPTRVITLSALNSSRPAASRPRTPWSANRPLNGFVVQGGDLHASRSERGQATLDDQRGDAGRP
jgi:hypothetical protein